MEKVNLAQKLSLFSEHWSPKIVGRVNKFEVKVVKLKGEFVWHHHDEEDELFFVVKGLLLMKVRDDDGTIRDLWVEEGEFVIIPHMVEHMPVAEEEVHLVLLEPAGTLNTGNVENERTVKDVPQI
ncbi:MAG: cupin domain-containing protein [Burkholderiales bacterium]|nr:cupin domain-containing protein [Anaerolineae bacterium]